MAQGHMGGVSGLGNDSVLTSARALGEGGTCGEDSDVDKD